MKCLNCEGETKYPRRGLCFTCWKVLTIRAKFGRSSRTEPTERQLEATIARQMKSLPEWWDTETKAVREAEQMPWDKSSRDGLAV